MPNTRTVATVALALLVVLGALPLRGENATIDTCAPNQATTKPCSIELPGLGTQPIVQTLPFDVPVFLTGKGPPELERLTVHIFHADNPLRVEELCDSSLNPDDCRYLCFQQGVRSRPQKAQREWSRKDLEGAAVTTACTVAFHAADWRSASQPAPAATTSSGTRPEQKYLLRLPPFQPNEHFVLLIEDEQRADPQQTARIQARVAAKIAEILNELERKLSDKQLVDWLGEVAAAGCGALEQIAREENVQIATRKGSLFDCHAEDMSAREDFEDLDWSAWESDLRALTEYLSSKGHVRVNLEFCATKAQELEEVFQKLQVQLVELGVDTGRWSVLQHLRVSEHRAGALARSDWSTRDEPPGEGNPCDVEAIGAVTAGYERLARELTAVKSELVEMGALANLVGKAQGLAETLRGNADAVQGARSRINILATKVTATVTNAHLLSGDTIGTFLTRQQGYIAADFGIAFAPEMEAAVPYVGTNVYLRPVNKNEPLALGDWRNLGKRFAFSIGFTLQKIDDEQVGPLFEDFNLLTGGGVRVTEAVRVSTGVMWAREKEGSPLEGGDSLTWSPYLSVSLDYDVNSLVKWFSKIFG